MSKRTYETNIVEASWEMTPKEKVKYKLLNDVLSLDIETQTANLVLTPKKYVVLDVHNEKSDNKDYQVFIIESDAGYKYQTGSKSFWNSFMDIWEDMKECEETWELVVTRKESKNYTGKSFLTCFIQ